MKIQNIEKKICAFLFCLLVIVVFGASVSKTYKSIAYNLSHNENEYEKLSDRVNDYVAIIDRDVKEHVAKKYECIEAYGMLNRLMGKKEINGFSYALDKKNAYESINFWSDAKDINFRKYAQQLSIMRDEVLENGGHFTFILAPSKMNDAWNEGYDEIPYNDFNEQADRLIAWLNFYGVDYIDLRETLAKTGMSFDEMFYKTDHHWTAEAAFEGYKEIVGYLNQKYDAGLDSSGFYRNENNYKFDRVNDSFLGSAGRSVGMKYGNNELEDFHKIKPLFKTKIAWTTDTVSTPSPSLYKDEYLEYDNVYKSDMYAYFMGGIHGRDTILNLDKPDAPTLTIIRDSYSSPLITNLAPLFGEIDASWGKESSDRYVKDQVRNVKSDYVIVCYYTENLTDEFFKFYADDVEEHKLKYAEFMGYSQEGDE